MDLLSPATVIQGFKARAVELRQLARAVSVQTAEVLLELAGHYDESKRCADGTCPGYCLGASMPGMLCIMPLWPPPPCIIAIFLQQGHMPLA